MFNDGLKATVSRLCSVPTRYCDSDKLLDFAWQNFGYLPHGIERVLGIINWLHRNIEYRTLSAAQISRPMTSPNVAMASAATLLIPP